MFLLEQMDKYRELCIQCLEWWDLLRDKNISYHVQEKEIEKHLKEWLKYLEEMWKREEPWSKLSIDDKITDLLESNKEDNINPTLALYGFYSDLFAFFTTDKGEEIKRFPLLLRTPNDSSFSQQMLDIYSVMSYLSNIKIEEISLDEEIHDISKFIHETNKGLFSKEKVAILQVLTHKRNSQKKKSHYEIIFDTSDQIPIVKNKPLRIRWKIKNLVANHNLRYHLSIIEGQGSLKFKDKQGFNKCKRYERNGTIQNDEISEEIEHFSDNKSTSATIHLEIGPEKSPKYKQDYVMQLTYTSLHKGKVSNRIHTRLHRQVAEDQLIKGYDFASIIFVLGTKRRVGPIEALLWTFKDIADQEGKKVFGWPNSVTQSDGSGDVHKGQAEKKKGQKLSQRAIEESERPEKSFDIGIIQASKKQENVEEFFEKFNLNRYSLLIVWSNHELSKDEIRSWKSHYDIGKPSFPRKRIVFMIIESLPHWGNSLPEYGEILNDRENKLNNYKNELLDDFNPCDVIILDEQVPKLDKQAWQDHKNEWREDCETMLREALPGVFFEKSAYDLLLNLLILYPEWDFRYLLLKKIATKLNRAAPYVTYKKVYSVWRNLNNIQASTIALQQLYQDSHAEEWYTVIKAVREATTIKKEEGKGKRKTTKIEKKQWASIGSIQSKMESKNYKNIYQILEILVQYGICIKQGALYAPSPLLADFFEAI